MRRKQAITIVIEPVLREWLEARRLQERRSLSQMVGLLLEDIMRDSNGAPANGKDRNGKQKAL
jgi:hypothetical protein